MADALDPRRAEGRDPDDTCGPFIPGTHIMPYSAVHSGPDDPPHYNADGPEYIWRFFCSQFNEWGLLP